MSPVVEPVPMPQREPAPTASRPQTSPGAEIIRGRFRRKARPVPRPLRLTPEERAFLPAALEVIETPASPTLRWTALGLCALIAIAVTWACLARIDTVAVAPGKAVPLGQVKVVQPLETAKIRAIHVDEGDHVVAGQLLVDLDPTEAQADIGALLYNHDQAALDAEVARVLMTRDPYEPFRTPAGIDSGLADQNHAQADREIERHLAVLAGIAADVEQKQAGIDATASQIERLHLILPILDERHAVLKGLYDKAIGARPPLLDAAQQLIEKRGELAAQEATLRQIEAEIRALRAKQDETRAAFLADATDRRTKALAKLAGLDQEITKARQKESYRRLVAPADGTVQGVKIHTPGAVVTTADVLMTVVPDGAGIEIEALVPNGEIGFVSEDQPVEVKLDAFPFTRFGLVKGRVRRLGRDAATSPASAGTPQGAPAQPDLAYPAKLSLDQDWILIDGRHEPIRPGMRVSAEIRTGDRRVIEYLLSPVVQALQEAGRER